MAAARRRPEAQFPLLFGLPHREACRVDDTLLGTAPWRRLRTVMGFAGSSPSSRFARSVVGITIVKLMFESTAD